MIDPLVSVIIPTYNHEKFIAQAIEGFLIQKTSFPFEVLINDDASTDGTAAIVRKYETEHPEIIKGFYQTENQFSKGNNIFVFLLGKAQGKYIAICEGDDYWTDPNKLQKQVDYLEAHKGYSGCSHNTLVISDDNPILNRLLFKTKPKEVFKIEDLLNGNPFHTGSLMYRSSVLKNLDQLDRNFPILDYTIHISCALQGDIGYLDEIMSVYRVHSGGIWSGQSGLTAISKSIEIARTIRKRILEPRYKRKLSGYIMRLSVKQAASELENGKRWDAAVHSLSSLLLSPYNPKYFKPALGVFLRAIFYSFKSRI